MLDEDCAHGRGLLAGATWRGALSLATAPSSPCTTVGFSRAPGWMFQPLSTERDETKQEGASRAVTGGARAPFPPSGCCLPPHHCAGGRRLLCLTPDLGFHTAGKRRGWTWAELEGDRPCWPLCPEEGQREGKTEHEAWAATATVTCARGPALGRGTTAPREKHLELGCSLPGHRTFQTDCLVRGGGDPVCELRDVRGAHAAARPSSGHSGGPHRASGQVSVRPLCPEPTSWLTHGPASERALSPHAKGLLWAEQPLQRGCSV